MEATWENVSILEVWLETQSRESLFLKSWRITELALIGINVHYVIVQIYEQPKQTLEGL